MLKNAFLNKLLTSKHTFILLILINVIVSIVVFFISSNIEFPDGKGYWLMGESILNGKFSSWYHLEKYYPETLRTPGYPMFLAFCQLLTTSQFVVKIVQLIIYFLSIYLCTLIIKKINQNRVVVNIFLLLLIPNVQVVYYTGYLSAEILSIFLNILVVYLIITRKKSTYTALLLALSCYASFIVRPAFLIFPFLIFIYFIFEDKKNFKFSSYFIALYLTLLIPYGIWNKINHGVFKITSIEGGAGVAHMGFWQLKLQDGYTEKYYWGNNTSYDYTKPAFYTITEQKRNTLFFEKEGYDLLNDISIYETKEDSLFLQLMKKAPDVLPLHNSEYTLAREKKLWEITKNNIMEEPIYYIKSRIYHFFRYYVTGINYRDLQNATNLLQKTKVIYPFVVTFLFIFCGLIYLTISMLRKKNRFPFIHLFVLMSLYYGVIHLPFVIQARYTIPIHLLIIMGLALVLQKNKYLLSNES